MTHGVAAIGTLLKISDMTATPVYATIKNNRDITGPGFTTDLIDTTSHDTTGGWETKVPGVKRTGEVTFDINYVADATQAPGTTSLWGRLDSRTLLDFRIVMPVTPTTGKTIAFSGYVTGFEPSFPVDGLVTASITISVIGAPTWDPA